MNSSPASVASRRPWVHSPQLHPSLPGRSSHDAAGDSSFWSYFVYTIEDDTIEDDGKLWDDHAFHTVLRSDLADLNTQPGDEIGIKYFAKPKSSRSRNAGSWV